MLGGGWEGYAMGSVATCSAVTSDFVRLKMLKNIYFFLTLIILLPLAMRFKTFAFASDSLFADSEVVATFEPPCGVWYFTSKLGIIFPLHFKSA